MSSIGKYFKVTKRPRQPYKVVGTQKKQKKYVPKLRDKEAKVVDIAAAAYACDTTGSVTLLNGVAQGDDSTNRDGRITYAKSIKLEGYVGHAVPASGVQMLAAVYLIWDKQGNGAAPAITDIFNLSSSTSPLNLNNRDRFTVLRHQAFALNTAINSINHRMSIYVNLNKPEFKTVYGGTGATVASINTGALYLVTLGDIAAGGTGGTCITSSRFRFIDP